MHALHDITNLMRQFTQLRHPGVGCNLKLADVIRYKVRESRSSGQIG